MVHFACRHPKWAERNVHAMTLDVLLDMDEDLHLLSLYSGQEVGGLSLMWNVLGVQVP